MPGFGEELTYASVPGFGVSLESLVDESADLAKKYDGRVLEIAQLDWAVLGVRRARLPVSPLGAALRTKCR